MDAEDAGTVPPPWQTHTLHGHAAAERALLDAYRTERLHHAWLVGGPGGIGKATLAWRFARFLLANADPRDAAVQAATTLDVPAANAAAARLAAGSHGDVFHLRREQNDKTKKLFSEIRVDDVRRALGLFQTASASGGYRICIVDSVEDLNRSSANALLKIIEEPPPRSLFMLIAHRPGQLMPTLVSRCRRLMLAGLSESDVATVLQSLGPALDGLDPSLVASVASRAQGSVARALQLIDRDTLDLHEAVRSMVGRLPTVDWRAVHRLADKVGFSDERFAVVSTMVLDELTARLQTGASEGQTPRELDRLAQAWTSIRAAAREAEVLNLDKRPVLLGFAADLARAAGP